WNHTNGSALTVAPDITDLEQLVGTQVAIPAWWSIHNIVLQKMLRARGIRPVVREEPSKFARTVGLIVMSPSDMVPALANGAISGFTVADPFHAVAEARGVGRIHTCLGDVWRDHACCALLVHQDVIDRDPAAVQSLADSMLAAQQVIADDRAAAGRLLSDGRYLPQPAPAVARALDYDPAGFELAHPEWAPQRIGFQASPSPATPRRWSRPCTTRSSTATAASSIASPPRTCTATWWTTGSSAAPSTPPAARPHSACRPTSPVKNRWCCHDRPGRRPRRPGPRHGPVRRRPWSTALDPFLAARPGDRGGGRPVVAGHGRHRRPRLADRLLRPAGGGACTV